MIKFSRNIFLALSLLGAANTFAQSSSNSPYSQFGLGQLSEPLLPQTRSMGGIAAGIRRPGTYSNINLANPASYSAIKITTLDIGIFTGITSLSNGSAKENSFTGSLNHLAFAVPVNQSSALSFGLLPYSTIGYRSRSTSNIDTVVNDHVYSGDGGISKAYIGYGYQIGKHFSLGANLSYLFGKLERSESSEFPNDPVAKNAKNTNTRSVGGLSFDYGAQFFSNINKNVKLTLGYSATAGSKLNSTIDRVSSLYTKDASGNDNFATDSSYVANSVSQKLKLPITHRLGFAFEESNKWLIGADVTLGQWSKYREGSSNPGLQNTFGVAIGGQITPDITSVGSYFKLVDYRFGLKYDKSYIGKGLQGISQDIKQYAVTLGLGLPLPSNRTTFYKINLGAELGQRGTTQNGLIRERFANIYLGFTLNDKWFQRYKFD